MKQLLVTAGLVIWSAAHAGAADLPLPGEQVFVAPALAGPGWSVSIAPYLWAAGISGEVAQFGLPAVDVDASFLDILEHLDFGAMLASEFRYGRYGLFTDLMYVKISGAAATPVGLLSDSVSIDTKALTITIAPEYGLFEGQRGSLDIMAGIRVWSVDTDLSFSGGILDGLSANDGDTWVDPLVGAKGRFNLTPKLYLTGWAMAGGFGVASDFMWDALGGVGYEFNQTFSAVLGYRGTGVDFEEDGFVYDIVQHGPIAGLVIRF